jgi:DegV family protein with EDD domain
MKKYVITTDSTCDLPESFTKENNVDVIPVLYSVNDVVYGTPESNMDIKEFYDAMRNGIMPTTMACNIEDCKTVFEKYAKDNIDVLHLAFSSGLSSTYNNAVISANEIMEEYPDCKITVIDTLAASMGEGLLVYKAVNLKKDGKTLEEVATYIEENKANVISRFTVDDLHHLHRGGRVSKTTAIVGSLINVKPILHVDEEGLLKSLENTRGRKKSLSRILDMMEEATRDYEGTNDMAFLSHGDCEEDAKYIASEIEKRFGIKTMINILGQTIGTHTGPNLIALFFMGNKR